MSKVIDLRAVDRKQLDALQEGTDRNCIDSLAAIEPTRYLYGRSAPLGSASRL